MGPRDSFRMDLIPRCVKEKSQAYREGHVWTPCLDGWKQIRESDGFAEYLIGICFRAGGPGGPGGVRSSGTRAPR